MFFRLCFLGVTLLLAGTSVAGDVASDPHAAIDAGFRYLYNLDFEQAEQQFTQYERQYPDDPLGPVAQAARIAFSELNRLGILESRFFADDSAFRSRPKPIPNPEQYTRFVNAIGHAQALASKRLATNNKDVSALFAVTLASGLQADYSSLIETHNLEALHFTREATREAHALLATCPNCYDAYVATGISKYLIGDLSLPFRWVLRLGGFSGNKKEGMKELELAAEHGRYLAPFARILLAAAYFRDHQLEAARQILSQLHSDFPANPLFCARTCQIRAPR